MPNDILTDNPMRLIIENDLLRIMFRRAVVSILLSIGYWVIPIRQPHYNSDATEIMAFPRGKQRISNVKCSETHKTVRNWVNLKIVNYRHISYVLFWRDNSRFGTVVCTNMTF
jgi:hypothetical protein